MGNGIGLGLSSTAICFDFCSTNVVQLSNRNPSHANKFTTSLDTISTLEMVNILCRLCAFLENRPAKKLILLRLELSGTGERKPILGFSLLLRDRRLDPIVWVWAMKEKCSPVSWKTAYPFYFRAWGAGGAMASPIFGTSVKPISTRGQIMSANH